MTTKLYKVTYIDEIEETVIIDKKGLSNLIMSIDCVGGEIISVEEMEDK